MQPTYNNAVGYPQWFFCADRSTDVWLPAVAGGGATTIDLPNGRQVDGGVRL